jgi:hypothetical protein
MTSSRTSRHSNALDTHNLATSPFAAGDDDAILSPSQGPSFLLDDRTADQWGELSDGEYLQVIYLPHIYWLTSLLPQGLNRRSLPIKLDRSKMDSQGRTSM